MSTRMNGIVLEMMKISASKAVALPQGDFPLLEVSGRAKKTFSRALEGGMKRFSFFLKKCTLLLDFLI